MFKPGLITAAVLTMLLSACGGGESTVTGDSTGTDTGGTDTGGTDTGGTDTGGTTTDVSAGLGAGAGSEHKPGELTLSASTILTGGSVTVTVNGVDKNDNNSDLTNSSYQYTFSSVCASANPATASLSNTSTFSSSGSASTVYANDGCTGSDTITAQLFSQTDDVSVATPLATATATLQATAPQLGFGSGVDYRDGKIDGELDLVGVTETVLTANAVNPLELNALVDSEEYMALWISSCDTANFSIQSQTLNNSTIQTRYDADVINCTGDNTITLKLVLASNTDTVLDTTSTIVKVSSSSTGSSVVVPSVGSGTDGDFREGRLTLSSSRTVTGTGISVSADLVDKNNSNERLASDYQYVFRSECANPAIPDGASEAPAATATFTLNSAVNSGGAITTVYTPSGVDCVDSDTITLSVYEAAANPATDTAVATATRTVDVSLPLLGIGSGSEFRVGEFGGNLSLVDVTETTLTANAVNPLDSNSLISSSEYEVSWISSCDPGGEFSIKNQNLASGSIETRYNGSSDSCQGSNEITLFLSWNDIQLDSIIQTVSIATTSSSALPALGSGTGADFNEGVIELSVNKAVVGDDVDVSVNLVDKNNSNSALSENYQYVFSSVCAEAATPTATFTVVNTTNNSGLASSRYTNIDPACGNSDTITVTLKSVADNSTVATATATIQLAAPRLGFGSGADYRDDEVSGEVSGVVTITDTDEATLTANAVDPLSSNASIRSSEYSVGWSSDCDDGLDNGADYTFSVQSQDLTNGDISTRYESRCDINNLTLVLSRNGIRLDELTTQVRFENSVSNVDPGVGAGTGTSFREGELALSMSRALVGQEVLVTADLVDINAGNERLFERYTYEFTSNCVSASHSRFSTSALTNSVGTASSAYTNTSLDCGDSDIVTVTVKDPTDGSTLATATGTIELSAPALGLGVGAEFRDSSSDLAVSITGDKETILSADAVNPLDANSAISSDLYEVRWVETTTCTGDARSNTEKFSVVEQALSSSIETRYIAANSAPTCTDTVVSASLYLAGGTDVLDSINIAVTLQQTSNSSATPDIGLSSGDDFIENTLGLSDSNVLVGEPVIVTVNLVDSDALNALLSERYQFNFTSNCDTSAAFSRANVISSTGTATTTYTPSALACASGDITVTAQLVDLGTGNDVTGVTAMATLNTTLPKLGTGTATEFRDAPADLAVIISGGNETTLTADVVNPLNANTAISSDLYEVRWTETTACASGAGSFSVPNQLLDSSIATRYSSGAAAPTCTRSEVTAALYLAGGTELLDSIVIDVTLEEEGTSTDQITIGSGTGDSFLQGNLAFSDSVALIGDALTVSVNLVDSSDSQYVLLPERYRFDFESDCDSSTEFARSETISSTGTASTQYTPSIACIDVDTDSDDVVDRGSIGLTVKLVDADTGVVVTDENSAPIQASGTISVTAPKLGLGIEAEFRDDPSDLAVSISSNVDETYLVLNAVNPLDANSEVTSPVYWVEWEETSSCTTALATFKGTFSVQRQPLSSEIRTRYEIGNGFEDCGTEVEVKASLYLADGSQSLINAIAVLDTVSIKVTKDSGTSPSTAIPDLGLGNGDDFLENTLGLSDSNVLVGEPVTVTVNLVDSDDLNALLSERYQFNFTSDCDTSTAFSRANVISSTGTAITTYTPSAVACASGDITVTAQLVDLDTGNDVTGVTATATLNATLPTLGTGTGAEFSAAAADLAVTITGSNATTLTADAVNPLNANAAISSDRYELRWTETTACASGAGNFSVASQPLNSAIETRYTTGAAAPTCTSSEVTASLYLAGGTEVLDSIVIEVSLTEAGQNEVVPALGANSGSDFIEGALLLSDFDVLVGGSLTVEVSGVNKVDGNSLLADTYQYIFSSQCNDELLPSSTGFSIAQTFSANEAVTSTYRNIDCAVGAVITVKLFEADANPDTATPLDIASAEIDTARPLLGSGFGSSFIEDSVSGETELDGEEETTLTLNLVDPLNANALIRSDDYVLEWGADAPATCSTGDFSISKQSFDTGAVSTRYSTELSPDGGNDCTGTHTINVIVYERTSTAVCDFSNTSGCLDSAAITLTVTQGVDARLGTGEEDAFVEGGITIFPDSIGAGSSALISVNIVDANSTPQYQKVNNRSYGVKVTSGCAAQVPSQASFTYTETIVAQGLATFSYTAAGCTGSEDIEVELFKVVDGTIDITSSLGTAKGTISIADVELGAISYNSTTAEAISISTIGDAVLPKQAVLTFTVTDENGDNLENETVEFELTNTTGGVALAQPSDVTNADGQVTAIINSGTSHTVVAVIAKVQVEGADTGDKADDIYIQTSSQPIAVTTGIADQDSFSVSIDIFNPAAYNKNGVSLTVTAYAADQYQNPVADGTTINFTAESGIVGSSCLTLSGTCSVNWISSGVRPGNHDPSLSRVNDIEPSCAAFSSDSADATYPSSSGSDPFEQYCFDRFENGYKTVLGLTTIMAYTSGEAGFTDQNGNGKFDFFDIDGDDLFTLGVDETEPFIALPEAFRDDNSDGILTVDSSTNRPVEFFADFNSDDSYDGKPDYYQGVVCSDTLLEQNHVTGLGHCNRLTHIFSSVRIIQSTSTAPDMTLYTYDSIANKYEEQDSITLGASGTFYVLLQDENGHMPANETIFSIAADGFKVSGDTGAVSNDIGSLYEGEDVGLPGFGQLFRVYYEVDDLPVSITVIGAFDGATNTLRLTP